MRPKLWSFDTVVIDLEDRDVTMKLTHERSLAEVTVQFRIPEKSLEANAWILRRHAELLATDKILDLASFLDAPRSFRTSLHGRNPRQKPAAPMPTIPIVARRVYS
jgi:hypothetical protein